MGLWSKHRHFSSVSVSPLFETQKEDARKKFLKDAVYRSVTTGTDVVEELLFASRQHIPDFNLDQFYEYGLAKGLTPRVFKSEAPYSVNYMHDGEGPFRDWYYTELTNQKPYPVYPMRTDKITVPRSKDNPQYIQLKKALGYLGASADPLLEGIDENPDVDKVEDAYLTMSVPITIQSQEGLEYLYRYFLTLESNGKDFKGVREPTYYNYGVGELKLSIGFRSVELKKAEYGQVGPLGEFISGWEVRPDIEVAEDFDYAGNDVSARPTIRYYDNSIFYIRIQVSPNYYVEVEVTGLTHGSFVRREAGISTYTIKDLEDEDLGENFFILMDDAILDKDLDRDQRLLLARRSASMHINSYERKYVKWYERGLIRFILIAIVLAVAVVTQQWYLLALMFAQPVLESLGIEWLSTAISIVMAIYSLGTSIAADLANLAAMTAQELLKFTMSILSQTLSLAQQGYEVYLQEEYKDLVEEFINWEATTKKDLLEELEEQESLLAGEHKRFNYIGQPYFNPNETPEQFFNRTVNTPNPGAMIYDLVENYADLALDLPKGDVDLIPEKL